MANAVGITDITAITAAVIGVAALVLSITNYLRDNPKVTVELFWDRRVVNMPEYDTNKLWGLVLVSNVGRRPVYISHAAIKLPKGYKDTHLLLLEGIRGKRLVEGDPPAHFALNQEGLEQYAKDWRKLRAVVNDSAGESYKSKSPRMKDRPSWASPPDSGDTTVELKVRRK